MPFRQLSAPVDLGIFLLLCALLLGCENDYPIAPTACDDWCYATQRAHCREDHAPEECVSICEDTALGRRIPRCEPEWIELGKCYRRAPDSDFICVRGYSQPQNTVCLAERRRLNYCVSERSGVCFDNCVRTSLACDEQLSDCEWTCPWPIEDCEKEQHRYEVCEAEHPVECTEAPENTANCCNEALALLECAGFEGDERCAERQ